MRLEGSDCLLLVIDLQERLVPVMHQSDLLLAQATKLITGLGSLGIPLVMSEQYPKGLGPTVEGIRIAAGATKLLPKLSFSCMDDEGLAAAIRDSACKSIIVCGVESHVCVLQTVIDLLDSGYRVALVADAVSSRDPRDRDLAISRMRQEGAVITSVESILFEICRRAGTEQFKLISRLVK